MERIEQEIRNLCDEFIVREVAFDPWSFRRSAELLSREGVVMTECPQSPERMSHASENLYRLIDGGQLRHDGGVVDSPGLYALGLPVLRRRKSTFIYGIEDDACDVIDHLTRYLAVRR